MIQKPLSQCIKHMRSMAKAGVIKYKMRLSEHYSGYAYSKAAFGVLQWYVHPKAAFSLLNWFQIYIRFNIDGFDVKQQSGTLKL